MFLINALSLFIVLKLLIQFNSINYVDSINNSNSKYYHDIRLRRNAFSIKQNSSHRIVIESDEKPAINNSKYLQRPRFTLSRNLYLPIDPSLYKCGTDEQSFTTQCNNKTINFREKILLEFHKYLSESVHADEPNYYNVEYDNVTQTTLLSSSSIPAVVCLVINTNVRTLRKKDFKFNDNKIADLLPKQKFIGRKYEDTRSCAIISSAGSLAKAKLGDFIDSHDIVMRFNHAPVEGYQSDVGRKTTIRVVNSQVVSKKEYNFLDSPIFQNVTIAAWDPGKFNGTLLDWLRTPDFNLFHNYQKFMEKQPYSNFYLINPRSIWNLWKTLQIFHKKYKIRKNPPSSGFIGLALLLPFCSYVDIIEYIPSTRLNGRCHYYSDEVNPACTFGAWHPLAAEKLMTYGMNSANDNSVFQNGIIRILRPEKRICDALKIKP